MVVNTVMGLGTRRRPVIMPSGSRDTVHPVNLSGEAMRQHIARIEADRRAAEYRKGLDAAALALRDANDEADRLRREVERLEAELSAERVKSERQQKRQTKQKKDDQQPQEAV